MPAHRSGLQRHARNGPITGTRWQATFAAPGFDPSPLSIALLIAGEAAGWPGNMG